MIELSLDISRSNNLKVIRLFDTSYYPIETNVDNYLIEVLPVNRQSWVTFYVNKNFSLALNSSNLGYKVVSNKKDLTDLPDGVYEIKQSYKPNAGTVIHYYHLRTTQMRLKFLELLCTHFSSQCKKEERAYSTEVEKLDSIRQYLDAAEYMVNDNHNKKEGIKYYNKAVDLVKLFEDECSCR